MPLLETIVNILLVFGATVVLVAMLGPVCHHYDHLDKPSDRKQHGKPVPLAGGFAIVVVAITAMSLAAITRHVPLHGFWWIGPVLGLGLLVVGTIDDRIGLSPRSRLVAQLTAALLLVYPGGYLVTSLGTLGELGWASVPFTVCAIITFLNACNMIDGADGLVGAVLVPPLIAISCVSSSPLSWGAGIMACAIAGFLVHNWPTRSGPRRGRVFLGNGGVLFTALVVSDLLIRVSGPNGPLLPGSVPWLVMIPLLEISTSSIRRVVRRTSPLGADRDHLHHRLERLGVSPPTIAIGYLGLATATTLVGVAIPSMQIDGIVLWAVAAAILTCATLLELWWTSRRRFALG